GSAAELRGEDAGLHLKLGDRIDRRRVVQTVVVRIQIDAAIQHERGVVGSSAGHAETADRSLAVQVLLHGTAAAVGSGYQQRELQKLASVQGQRTDFLFADYRSLRRGFRIEQ